MDNSENKAMFELLGNIVQELRSIAKSLESANKYENVKTCHYVPTTYYYGKDWHYCDKCGAMARFSDGVDWDFCPNCGAKILKMRIQDENND